MRRNFAKLKIGLITGGPSLERGISLNSARSVMDHLESEEIEIIPVWRLDVSEETKFFIKLTGEELVDVLKVFEPVLL